jgi:hypothetical protein
MWKMMIGNQSLAKSDSHSISTFQVGLMGIIFMTDRLKHASNGSCLSICEAKV